MMPNKPTTLRELEKEFEDNCPWLASTYEEDAKNRKWVWEFFVSYLTSHSTELISKIEGMKKQEWLSNGAMTLPAPGNMQFNQALDQVISFINQEK